MKRATFLSIVGLGLLSFVSVDAKVFKSADGSKTIRGNFVSYNPSSEAVTIHLNTGKKITTAASNFSDECQAYFIEQQAQAEKFAALKIKVTSETNKPDEVTKDIYVYQNREELYTVEVRNTSDFAFEDIKVKVTAVVNRNTGDGDTKVVIEESNYQIKTIAAKGKQYLQLEPFVLVHKVSSNSGCPTCVQHAASYNKERVVGLKVDLVDEEGAPIVSESTSRNVDKALQRVALEQVTR